jgi:CIC family chloride channel protein
LEKIKQQFRKLRTHLQRFSERQTMIILALFTGVLCGLAAGALKYVIHFLQNRVLAFDSTLFYFICPAFGMLLTVLIVKYLVKDNISHGVTRVLYAMSRKESKLPKHNMWTSLLASAVTIGFGGSVGAEAPIVLTGSAIGSNIGRKMKLNYKNITLLLACGAAGAVSGIFKAPIAGVIFTLDVLLIDITLSSVAPLLISSVAATLVSYVIVGHHVEFAAGSLSAFEMSNFPFYIALGVFCGFVGLYFTRTTFFIEGLFARMRRPYLRPLVGGVILGVTIFLFPPLYGEGYGTITALLNGSEDVLRHSFIPAIGDTPVLLLIYLFMLLIFKVIAMSATNGGGGVGGTFGPTLFVGGISGFFLVKLINLTTGADLPVANFTLVGMAGTMAAVMHSPLTAIFLIAEITGGYTLFVPLIITAATSFTLINYFEPYSIYTKRLARRGDLLTQNKDQAALMMLRTEDFIETDFSLLLVNGTLGDIVRAVAKTRRNVFPVVDASNKLMGVVLLDDIRADMFNITKYNVSRVYDYMQSPSGVVLNTDSVGAIARLFEKTGAWNMPMTDKENNYIGFVSKSKILTAYREALVKMNE